MADVYSEIKDTLQKICRPKCLQVYFAEIVSVEDDTTCTIKIDDDLQLSDVRLRAVVNDEQSGILITPKKGSIVLVADLSGGKMAQMSILMYSEVDHIEINGGDKGGLINIEDLTDKLNKLVDEVNALKDTFNSHVHTGTGYASTPLSIQAPVDKASDVTKFNKSDFEDDKIQH